MKSYKSMSKEELLQEKDKLKVKLTEYIGKRLELNMTRGLPSTAQLELSNSLYDGLSKSDFVSLSCPDVRNYGILNGLVETREFFASFLKTDKENIFVGNGSSLNLMFDSLMRSLVFGEVDSKTPWINIPDRKWLCPVPGYDRHFKVTEKLGFKLIPVPLTENGPDMDIVEELSKDPTVLGIWNVPCYTNPDGYVYSQETCERLASMKTGAKDFRIYWDNAYSVHHLYDEESKQASIPDILGLCEKYGNPNRVYEFASTSKITFAGAGVSVMATNKDNMEYALKILGIQTIGSNKVNQYAHNMFLPNMDSLRKHMDKHRSYLRPKFEAVLEILDKELSGLDIVSWHKPMGGYFISVYVYKGTAKNVVKMCNDMGVKFTPAGATYPYGIDPDDSNIRISPSFPTVDENKKAIEVFSSCAKLCAIEKILEERND